MQTIGGGCRGGGVAGGCHGVDGVEDGGEEVRVGEAWIRRRRWAARVPVPFGTVPALARNGGGGGERRGGASRRLRANPRGKTKRQLPSFFHEHKALPKCINVVSTK